MPDSVLIAEELRDLLGADPLPGRSVRWVASGAPIPAGPFTGIVPLLTRHVRDDDLARLPQLRVIANCATGVDNIDLAAAERRGIVVTNTPGVLTESTADLTWALILAAARRINEGRELLLSGGWQGWNPNELLGLALAGHTLGIVGAGRIGQAVGRRALGFGMRLLYTSRTAKPEFEAEMGARHVVLDSLLAGSDVVSLHVRSTPETVGLMDAASFGRMKAGSIFVNTARGDLVHEPALLEALDSGRLRAAGLDVFSSEPEVDRRLLQHPRIVALPHLGSATSVSRKAMAALAVRNVQAVLDGGEPLTPALA